MKNELMSLLHLLAFEESFNPVDMNTPLTVGAKVKSSISSIDDIPT